MSLQHIYFVSSLLLNRTFDIYFVMRIFRALPAFGKSHFQMWPPDFNVQMDPDYMPSNVWGPWNSLGLLLLAIFSGKKKNLDQK